MNKNNTPKKASLGRGLSSLLGENKQSINNVLSDHKQLSTIIIPIELITPGPWQARKNFDKKELENLALSIKTNGIIQPILVKTDDLNSGKYLIIAGERRWRAAQLANLHEIPAIVRNKITTSKINEISLLENLQRSDLNPIEEAIGFQNLMKNFKYSQQKISEIVGKSRPYIANIIRLLLLPPKIKTMLINGQLSIGHVRPLIGREDCQILVDTIIKRKMNVRDVEKFVSKIDKPFKIKNNFVDNSEVEQILSEKLGLKVKIKYNKKLKNGTVTLACKTLDQFDYLIDKLKTI